MRLIDADALSQDWETVLKEHPDEKGTAAYRTFELFIEYLEKVRTIDAVPVIRCAECKHQEDCEKQVVFWKRNYVTEQNENQYNKIDFCSYGERKE